MRAAVSFLALTAACGAWWLAVVYVGAWFGRFLDRADAAAPSSPEPEPYTARTECDETFLRGDFSTDRDMHQPGLLDRDPTQKRRNS